MDLLTQLNRAMIYVEENICSDLTLGDVSSVTAYSEYHFGRMFYYIAEMPLSEYIRKRKLSLAAMDLQSGCDKVIDLAVKYGYDSADSFTRAFVKQHGITPTVARKSGAVLKIFPPITFQIKIKGVHGMNMRIEKKEAFEVFGIERIFNIGAEGNNVPEFWAECHKNGSYEKLFDDACGVRMPPGEFKAGPCVVNGFVGVHEPGGGVMPYMICAVKTEKCKTEGYKIAQIPAATWAVFRSEESDDIGVHIPNLFNRAYSEWLPSSGYDKGAGPDMEIYGITASGKYYDEVWIPVVKR
ncbi:MAG: AraC family transcriptional regulator [Defluviitaleaceae bacterium]|nr:AraC family transcriptional regulator [Defluviitaleaceae bacterium]